jgi:hemin uptake protein HemP
MSTPEHSNDDVPAASAGAGGATGDAEPVLDSAALLQGGRTALIRHNGATYRLHATRAGKLILTK